MIGTHLIDTIFTISHNIKTGGNHTHCIKLHDKRLRSYIGFLIHFGIYEL